MSPTGSRVVCLFVCRGSEGENSSRDSPGRCRAQDFDPLGLKPEDPEALKEMQTKELQHGREHDRPGAPDGRHALLSAAREDGLGRVGGRRGFATKFSPPQ